jgi:hypothetical protein
MWNGGSGPPPAPQIDKGFGMKLLQLGLKPFLGVADIRLEPAGLVCNLYLELPEQRQKALPSSSFCSGGTLDGQELSEVSDFRADDNGPYRAGIRFSPPATAWKRRRRTFSAT